MLFPEAMGLSKIILLFAAYVSKINAAGKSTGEVKKWSESGELFGAAQWCCDKMWFAPQTFLVVHTIDMVVIHTLDKT